MARAVVRLIQTDEYRYSPFGVRRHLWDCMLQVGRDRLFFNRYATDRTTARRAAIRIAKKLGIVIQDDLKRKDI